MASIDIGICVASHIGDIDYIVRAEELGYSHAWLADSQMLWSDWTFVRSSGSFKLLMIIHYLAPLVALD